MDIFEDFIIKLKIKKNQNRATLVFLNGDLGSGKTTFTKNLCKYLNLDIEIHSPTFVILKKYDFNIEGFENLIHIDAYRLSSYNDLKKIKFEDYLSDKNNLVFIEWPELVADESLIPDISIEFDYIENINDRSIKIV